MPISNVLIAKALGPHSSHRRADGVAHRDSVRIEVPQAEDVDPEMIGSNALAVKWIDATRFAEVVARRHRVKTIFGEGVFSRKQLEPRLVDFNHQRILAATDRAVAAGELGEVALDFEPDGAAMAAAFVLAHRSTGHRWALRRDHDCHLSDWSEATQQTSQPFAFTSACGSFL